LTKEIVNRVQNSGLITLEMKSFYGDQERVLLDIKHWLHGGLILKEKPFRDHLKNHDWSIYKNKFVGVYCSEDTIIPIWAFMLVSTYLNPYTTHVYLANKKELEKHIFQINIQQLNIEDYTNKKVLIKGCSETYIPQSSYIEISKKLINEVHSLMFGEACSNVPLFKKKK